MPIRLAGVPVDHPRSVRRAAAEHADGEGRRIRQRDGGADALQEDEGPRGGLAGQGDVPRAVHHRRVDPAPRLELVLHISVEAPFRGVRDTGTIGIHNLDGDFSELYRRLGVLGGVEDARRDASVQRARRRPPQRREGRQPRLRRAGDPSAKCSAMCYEDPIRS
eukprot:gene10641-biopygen4245